MKILLTGGTGFLGHHLYDALRRDNQLYLLSSKKKPDHHDAAAWIQHDLREPSLPASLPRGIDVIYHFAAQTGAASIENRDEHHRINTDATLQLLEYAGKTGVKSFIYASSGGVYGMKDCPSREGDSLAPCDFYNQTKFESEVLVQKFSAHFRTAVLRFFFLFGPGQERSRLTMSLVDKILTGKKIILRNGGKPLINPIYISDAIEAIRRVSVLPESCVMNIAGTENTDIRRLSIIIGKLLAFEPAFEDVEDARASNLLGDISMMIKTLGFTPRVSLREGIQNTMAANLC